MFDGFAVDVVGIAPRKLDHLLTFPASALERSLTLRIKLAAGRHRSAAPGEDDLPRLIDAKTEIGAGGGSEPTAAPGAASVAQYEHAGRIATPRILRRQSLGNILLSEIKTPLDDLLSPIPQTRIRPQKLAQVSRRDTKVGGNVGAVGAVADESLNDRVGAETGDSGGNGGRAHGHGADI